MDKLDVVYLGPKDEPGMDKDHVIASGLNAYGRLIREAGTVATKKKYSIKAGHLERKTKGKLGGYRPGSGNKKGVNLVAPENKRNLVQVRLPQYLIDWMYTQDKSLTKVIEHAVTVARRNALTS